MADSHEHVLDLLDDYLHGAIASPAVDLRIDRHCRTCRICAVALQQARIRRDALASLAPVESSDALVARTLDHVETVGARRDRINKAVTWALLATAASVALAIGGMHVYYATLRPSPFDLRVLGQATLLPETNAAIRVGLFDQRTNRPVEDVPIEIVLADTRDGFDSDKAVRLASFSTGPIMVGQSISVPDWEDGSYRLYVTAHLPEGVEQIIRPIELRRSWKLMLSTDKPVYRPGQTIRMRSLGLRRPDLKPVAGSEASFTVTDPKGNVIFRRTDVTSKFGIASADCPIAGEVRHGAYEVACTVGNTTSRRTVEVFQYALPKFRVAVESDRPYYGPGDRVRLAVQADYFFGRPVAGATVDVAVRPVDATAGPVTAIQARTDGAGHATVEFALPQTWVGREQDSGNAAFWSLVTVTDTAGQKADRTVRRIVTDQPIQIEVVPESGTLLPRVPNTIYVLTTYADGRPAATRVAVNALNREIETNALGVASFELARNAGTISLVVKATDRAGLAGRRSVELACNQIHGDFLFRTDRAVYEGGQTMTLAAIGGGVEPVLVDFIKDGQTLLTQTVEMADGRGDLVFDLPPELFGTVELCAFRYGPEGLPLRRMKLIHVRPAARLRIETTTDAPEYRPGESAEIQFRLTDAAGNPVPGAIGLAAVDEAVFSVIDQTAGAQGAFFLLEREMLEPIYAVYNWSPDLTAGENDTTRAELEQALFARAVGRHGYRSAALRKMADQFDRFDQSTLDALQRPDWEGELQKGWLPRAVRDFIAEEFSAHSIGDRTFPEHEREVRSRRRAGLNGVGVAWFFFVVIGGAVFLVWGLATGRIKTSLIEWLVVIVIVGMLAALLLPAVGASMSSARRAMEMAAADSIARIPSSAMARPSTPRVRQWFPETLLWRPELVTDDEGRASLSVPLADSITDWRLTTAAVSTDGQLGGAEHAIRVFQPFFVDLDLPPVLTRNDEVSLPAVVHNHLDEPQSVELKLNRAEWFEPLDAEAEVALTQQLELAPREVRSVHFPIKILHVGRHQLEVTARAGDVADAIRREIEVVPDGRAVRRTVSGTLSEPAEMTVDVPETAVPGSPVALVKLYPSAFCQLVEGLDAIFQMPSGCFEQTSSTTYPNVLALDYLRRTRQSRPAVEAKARQYIHVGYQRLASFEVAGGGFDWFGRPPANVALSAYGLMEFRDMARVHDVDPRLIERTRAWLLERREADGRWGGGADDVAVTAYVAWAVFGDGRTDGDAALTLDRLFANSPRSIDDPFVLAMVANAIEAIRPEHPRLAAYRNRLVELRHASPDGKLTWWQQSRGRRTLFHGAGRGGDVETTALAVLALLGSSEHRATASGALRWIAEQKDDRGTWHSTQATVMALKALLAGTGRTQAEPKPRLIEIRVDDHPVRELTIPVDQFDVVRQIELPEAAEPGQHRIRLLDRSGQGTGYLFTARHHVPIDPTVVADAAAPLSISVAYDRTRLAVDDRITAVATIASNLPVAVPMVIVDLPIPGGFELEPGELDALVGAGTIAKYQITPRKAIIYLRGLGAGQTLELQYGLRATMPIKVQVPPAEVYEYYNPDRRATGRPSLLEVVGGG